MPSTKVEMEVASAKSRCIIIIIIIIIRGIPFPFFLTLLSPFTFCCVALCFVD